MLATYTESWAGGGSMCSNVETEHSPVPGVTMMNTDQQFVAADLSSLTLSLAADLPSTGQWRLVSNNYNLLTTLTHSLYIQLI